MMSEDEITKLASRHGFSPDAVRHLHHGVLVGRGTMAQFSHPELGGTGQWMRGGMIMIGDMFNHALKARVAALCEDLARLPPAAPSPAPASAWSMTAAAWWPAELGHPAAAGGQNELQYAYFPDRNRLAVRDRNTLVLCDTTGYLITGFSQQQQPGLQGLYFSSQRGTLPVMSLRVVEVRE